ncbi:MAG TPA: glycine zipper 2TM domain-containing protein [Casimicrobiaceae bacterium]
MQQIVSTRNFAKVCLAIAAAFTLAACAPSQRSDVYQYRQGMRAQTVEMGVVESVRYVQLGAPNTGVGTVGGAALGGIAGSTIGGGGRANAAGAIAGAIIGGVVGNAVENNANQRNGIEVTVRLDSGSLLAIPQENAGENFRPGDRVRVLSDGRNTRVTY